MFEAYVHFKNTLISKYTKESTQGKMLNIFHSFFARGKIRDEKLAMTPDRYLLQVYRNCTEDNVSDRAAVTFTSYHCSQVSDGRKRG